MNQGVTEDHQFRRVHRHGPPVMLPGVFLCQQSSLFFNTISCTGLFGCLLVGMEHGWDAYISHACYHGHRYGAVFPSSGAADMIPKLRAWEYRERPVRAKAQPWAEDEENYSSQIRFWNLLRQLYALGVLQLRQR